MDFNYSDEQQMLRDGATRYLAEHYDFAKRRVILTSDSRCSAEQWTQFAELGWLALALPEDAGGLGCSFIESAVILEAMGGRLVLEPYAISTVLCARILERGANTETRAALLPAIASGELRLALAHEESGRRSSTPGLLTTAQRAGSGHQLDGSKMLAYGAPNAGKLIVTARFEASDAPSIWVIDRDAPGVQLAPYALIDGTLAADLTLTAVRVPPSALLAGPDRAAELLDEALDRMVLAQVAEALGAMEAVLQITAEQIRNRSQFGQPLAKFQALQHRMAEMFVEVQETRSILYRGLAYLDGPAERRLAAVSAAKVVASAAARVVGGQGIQLHGAVGVTDEYAVGHYFRRLLVLEKAFGDADFHLGRLAGTYR